MKRAPETLATQATLLVCGELIGMLVNVVNGHVQKRQQKRITKKQKMSLASLKAIALYQLCNGWTMDFKCHYTHVGPIQSQGIIWVLTQINAKYLER